MAVRHTLLGLLSWGPTHGYRLRQIAREYSWMYPMTNASIYPSLHGLEAEGFVEHDTEIHRGRARKVYRITQAGEAELERWVADPPRSDSVARDHLLVKISMLNDDRLPNARAWLEEAVSRVEEELRVSQNDARSDEIGRYTQLAKEYGVEMLRLRLRFLERVMSGANEETPSAVA